MKEEIGTQVNFMLQIHLQKYVFQQNMTTILAANVYFLNSCQDGNVHTYATAQELKKKGFKFEKQEYESSNCHTIDLKYLEINLQKHVFQQNMVIFVTAIVSFSNPCQDGNVHTYATTKEMKKKAFITKREKIKQTFDIQLTFILKIKPSKVLFLAKRLPIQSR